MTTSVSETVPAPRMLDLAEITAVGGGVSPASFVTWPVLAASVAFTAGFAAGSYMYANNWPGTHWI
jgi:hypothetical protein